jgi:hypothetical protein
MSEHRTPEAMAICETPSGKLRWLRGNGPCGSLRLQQHWQIQYWQHGYIYKQYDEWRDVPEETAP